MIIKSGKSIVSKIFKTLEMKAPWGNWFGNEMTENFRIVMKGKPKSGKTTTAICFADYLQREHGMRVIYISAEEGHGYTMTKRLMRLNMSETPIRFGQIETAADRNSILEDTELLKNYDAVFVDSWQKLQFDDEDFKKFSEMYPDKAIVVVSQLNNKKQSGLASTEHEADIIMTVGSMQGQIEGRFGAPRSVNIDELFKRNHLKVTDAKGESIEFSKSNPSDTLAVQLEIGVEGIPITGLSSDSEGLPSLEGMATLPLPSLSETPVAE